MAYHELCRKGASEVPEVKAKKNASVLIFQDVWKGSDGRDVLSVQADQNVGR